MPTATRIEKDYIISVDAWAAGSLAFVENLEKKFPIEYLGAGQYKVSGELSEIEAVITEHPNVVKQTEPV